MKIEIDQTFEAGQTYHLDTIYDLQGVIPNEAYEQDDYNMDEHVGDSGESVRFVKTVRIEATITVKG